jgi:hypothetical protein
MRRALRRQVLGQCLPLATRRKHVEDCVENLANIHLAPTAAALGWRDHRLNQRPFGIRQVTRISQTTPLSSAAMFRFPHLDTPQSTIRVPHNESQMIHPTRQLSGSALNAVFTQRVNHCVVLGEQGGLAPPERWGECRLSPIVGEEWGLGMRVLLIEDDSATAQSIELMLKSAASTSTPPISARKGSISARSMTTTSSSSISNFRMCPASRCCAACESPR